eukprot:2941947-Rhodomonas_salina.2
MMMIMVVTVVVVVVVVVMMMMVVVAMTMMTMTMTMTMIIITETNDEDASDDAKTSSSTTKRRSLSTRLMITAPHLAVEKPITTALTACILYRKLAAQPGREPKMRARMKEGGDLFELYAIRVTKIAAQLSFTQVRLPLLRNPSVCLGVCLSILGSTERTASALLDPLCLRPVPLTCNPHHPTARSSPPQTLDPRR